MVHQRCAQDCRRRTCRRNARHGNDFHIRLHLRRNFQKYACHAINAAVTAGDKRHGFPGQRSLDCRPAAVSLFPHGRSIIAQFRELLLQQLNICGISHDQICLCHSVDRLLCHIRTVSRSKAHNINQRFHEVSPFHRSAGSFFRQAANVTPLYFTFPVSTSPQPDARYADASETDGNPVTCCTNGDAAKG